MGRKVNKELVDQLKAGLEGKDVETPQAEVAQPEVKQERKPKRPTRIPVSGQRDILVVQDMDPNYHYRWVADRDEGQRLDKFLRAGYEVVMDRHKDRVKVGDTAADRPDSRIGGAVTKYAGAGETLVLMRILKEWYDEDQKAKQDEVNAMEESMFEQARAPGFYGQMSQTATRGKKQ